MSQACRCVSCITPPHLLKKLLESKDREVRQRALNTLLVTSRLRGERIVGSFLSAALSGGDGRRTIFDCRHGTVLSAAVVARTENGSASADDSVNRAFNGLGSTRDFYREVLNRNSIDGSGMRLDGDVHYDRSYNNAFWNGQKMVFGDGDGIIFTDFTSSLDVIGHELTHGVTEHAAGLEYHNQSGALNESISDVFGSLVKQWVHNQTADQADWLIGPEVFTPGIDADALRSMKAPGTAYNNPDFGKDPQPDHMSRYMQLPDNDDGDFGGVHINSGIPNKAFYLAAIGIGGFAWEAPGHIWYEALKASSPTTDFQAFADGTYAKADQLYGKGSAQQQAVLAAWREVGIKITGAPTRPEPPRSPPPTTPDEDDSLAALSRRVDDLAKQVSALAKEVGRRRR
jgi:Zn-dependent metalloprotease